eukprot:14410774-Alexandrium_andersonii.AAC.1
MSASLVGSEMCIRDRGSHTRQPTRAGRPPQGARGQPECAPPQQGWPVSYTHLTLPTICSV